MSNNKKLEEGKALMAKQAENTRSWANMANENDPIPMGPSSAPATYKAKTYLPDASKWAQKQATIEEEASAERAMTPNSLSESNLEDIRKTMYAYDNYTDKMGLPRRASRTPTPERRRRSDERRRTARRRQSPRRGQSPRRRSPSPTRRYGVGRRYVAAPGFGSRRRSPSPRRRSPSPRRRSPSPRYSRRRSPSPRYSRHGRSHRSPSPRRRSPSPRRRGSRNASPLRYTVANNGRTVNEFGRNVPARQEARGPRFNTRRQRRPVHVFDEKTKTYKPANWNV
jgi:hypothetical protein